MGVSLLHVQVGSFQSEPLHPSVELGLGGVAKRFFDVASVLLGGLLCVPLLLIVALAIKLDSRGPILFRQRRVGLDGREFWMYKFRSMVVDAEARQAALMEQNEMQFPLFKLKTDPRVTRVGRLLRRSSLDELPQLLNVLRGEMSLVGPRPLLVAEAEALNPHQLTEKFSVRPGLTGLWQVSGRNENASFDAMLEMDRRYAREWSFLGDLGLLLKTVPVVLLGRGAY